MIYRTCPLCHGEGRRPNPTNPNRWPVQPYRVVCSCCEGAKIIVDFHPETWRPRDPGIVEDVGKSYGDVLRDVEFMMSL